MSIRTLDRELELSDTGWLVLRLKPIILMSLSLLSNNCLMVRKNSLPTPYIARLQRFVWAARIGRHGEGRACFYSISLMQDVAIGPFRFNHLNRVFLFEIAAHALNSLITIRSSGRCFDSRSSNCLIRRPPFSLQFRTIHFFAIYSRSRGLRVFWR
jgi:hypothetical protein